MNKAEKQMIEDLLETLKLNKEIFEKTGTHFSITPQIQFKIEYMAKIINQQEKENEKLNTENINLKRNQIIDKSSIPDQENFYDYYNFISKDKIKDKLDELKDKEQELTDEQGYWGKTDLLAQIEVLQELLEEDK